MIYHHAENRRKRLRQLLFVLLPFLVFFAFFLNFQTNRTILQTMMAQSLVNTEDIKNLDVEAMTADELSQVRHAYPHFAQIAFVDSQDNHLYWENFQEKDLLQTIIAQLKGKVYGEEYGFEQRGFWIANRLRSDTNGPWLVEFYPAKLYASIKLNAIIVWSVVGLMLVVILYVAYKIIMMYISSPIKMINEGIQRVLEDDFTFEYVGNQLAEVDQLGETVMSLKDKLQSNRKELIASEQRLSLLLDHLNLGVVLIGSDHKIKLFNPEAKSLLQLNEHAKGRSFEGNVQSFVLIDMITQVLKDFKAKSDEIEVFVPKQKYIDVNIIPYREEMNQQHKGESVLLLLYDMSHLRRLEKVRSDFVANASHELRTPVTAIRGFAETLQDGAINDPELSGKFIKIIANESLRLEKLIQDILELSRVEQRSEPMHMLTFDLVTVIEELIEFLAVKAKAKNIRIDTYFKSQPLIMETDPGRVKQVIINLLDNAVTYSEPGKSIEIYAEIQGEEVEIRIKDHGIGIPKQDLQRIFERFYRVDKGRSRNSGGTGLGLSIVKNLLTILNGSISVTSEVNQGTEFTVRLPLEGSSNL